MKHNYANTEHEIQCFCTSVKLPPAISATHIRMLVPVLAALTPVYLLAKATKKVAKDGPSTWIPTIYVEDRNDI